MDASEPDRILSQRSLTRTPGSAVRNLLLACCAIVFGLAPIAAQAKPSGNKSLARVEIPFCKRAPRIDGKADEWATSPILRLAERSQLVPTGRVQWKGPRDASCEIRLQYDATHLYFLIDVVDQKPVPPLPDQTWESGDVLELFFDADLRDASTRGTRFDADDLQLLLIPYGRERIWAAIEQVPLENQGTRRPRAVDRGLTGLRVAKVRTKKGVRLEVALPLHDLPGLRAGVPEIGFNVAYGDRDPPSTAYNYLVWTSGRAPIDNTANFGRLVFAGPPVLLAEGEPGGRWLLYVGEGLLYLLPALLLLGVLALGRICYQGPLASRPKLARGLGLLSGAGVLACLLLPKAIIGMRQELRLSEAAERSDWLLEKLSELE